MLTEWVAAQGGVLRVSKLLGVARTTIYAWMYREAQPTTPHMLKLIKISKGELTFESLVRDTKPLDTAGGRRGAK